MSDFDPYLKWLGIRDPQRPPNHYRLLGLDLYENDVEVISMAADRQMAHVRTFQNGLHGVASQTILNEIAAARRCLLNSGSKSNYDRKLRSQQSERPAASSAIRESEMLPPTRGVRHNSPAEETELVAFASPIEQPAVKISSAAKPKRRQRSRKRTGKRSSALGQIIGIVGGGLAAVVVAYFVISSGLLDQFRQRPDSELVVVNNEPKASSKDINAKDADAKARKRPEPDRDQAKRRNNRDGSSDVSSLDPAQSPTERPKQPSENPPRLNPNRRKPPWEAARWPAPPEHLLRPKSTIDKLAQRTRVAISQRDYRKAREEWAKVKANVQRRNRNLDLESTIRELEAFWRVVGAQAKSARTADELEFRGESVTVQMTSPTSITLRYGKKMKRFRTKESVMDRDLAAALAKDAGYELAEITRLLGYDFAHESIVLGLDSFFEPGQKAGPPAVDSSVNRSPRDPREPALPTPTAAKKAIPEQSAVAKSKALVKELYPKAYARSSAYLERAAQAGEMLNSAITTKNVCDQYVLLKEACAVASLAGDSNTAIQAINQLDQRYEVDFWKVADQVAANCLGNLNSRSQAVELQGHLVSLSQKAVADAFFDEALQMAAKAQQNAKRKIQDVHHAELADRLRDHITEMREISHRGARAIEALKSDPSGKSSHAHAGNYFCFIKKDFQTGLVHWRKSNRINLSSLALAELSYKPEENNQLTIAKQWYEFGSSKKSYVDFQAMNRALHWFELALKSRVGHLNRKSIQSSIDEIKDFLADDPLKAGGPNLVASPVNSTVKGEGIYRRAFRFDNRQTGGSFTVRFLQPGLARITNARGTNSYPLRTSDQRVFHVDIGTARLSFTLINRETLLCRQTDKQTGRVTFSGRSAPNRNPPARNQ